MGGQKSDIPSTKSDIFKFVIPIFDIGTTHPPSRSIKID